jgi:parallel beta-helix repeat protein
MRKAFLTAILLLALVLSSLAGTRFPRFAAAQTLEDITINADGSVDPSTAPISQTGDVYTLTANVSASVTIEKSNTVFDGAGFTIQSPAWSWALKLTPPTPIESALSNITVKNVKVMEDPSAPNWAWGIMLDTTTNSVIANCTISDIRDSIGIWVQDRCTGNLIIGNNFTNIHHTAIYVWERNNTIVGNRITDCGVAIDFVSTSDNIILGNHIANNSFGVHCFSLNALPPGLRNLIYLNNFVNNTMSFFNEAVFIDDTGVLAVPAIVNIWDNGTAGNYWSDYTGVDADADGVGDTPYFIDDNYNLEGANDTDHYPLMQPVNTNAFTSTTSIAPASSAPTPSPSASDPEESTSSPAPTVPELTFPTTLVTLVAVTCLIAFLFKRKGATAFSGRAAQKPSVGRCKK